MLQSCEEVECTIKESVVLQCCSTLTVNLVFTVVFPLSILYFFSNSSVLLLPLSETIIKCPICYISVIHSKNNHSCRCGSSQSVLSLQVYILIGLQSFPCLAFCKQTIISNKKMHNLRLFFPLTSD